MATETATPFFIVGVERSGTTLLRMMLNCHSRLDVPFESRFIPDFCDRLEAYGDLSLRANRARLLADIARQPFVAMGGLLAEPEAILNGPAVTYPELVRAIFEQHARQAGRGEDLQR